MKYLPKCKECPSDCPYGAWHDHGQGNCGAEHITDATESGGCGDYDQVLIDGDNIVISCNKCGDRIVTELFEEQEALDLIARSQDSGMPFSNQGSGSPFSD